MEANEVYIIYADILFLINFIMDFACLYAAGLLTSARLYTTRIVAAAFCGGAYSLAAAYASESGVGWYITLVPHIAAALLICLIAFGKKRVFRRTAVFILTSAASGGILSAVFALSGRYYSVSGGFYAEISPVFLLVTAGFAVAAAYIYALICRKRMSCAKVDAVIQKDGRRFAVTLLCDSGCFVTDPISGRRVIIVSEASLSPSPPETLRAIPMKTAGGTRLLFGFAPDSVSISRGGRKPVSADAIIAVDSETKDFSGCDGLVPYSLIG